MHCLNRRMKTKLVTNCICLAIVQKPRIHLSTRSNCYKISFYAEIRIIFGAVHMFFFVSGANPFNLNIKTLKISDSFHFSWWDTLRDCKVCCQHWSKHTRYQAHYLFHLSCITKSAVNTEASIQGIRQLMCFPLAVSQSLLSTLKQAYKVSDSLFVSP